MIGMDCVNQQAVSDRDCSHCIWHTDGRCASWDCEYISRDEAVEAVRERRKQDNVGNVKEPTRDVQS